MWLQDRHSVLFIVSFLFKQHNLSELQWKWLCLCLNRKLHPRDKNQSDFCDWQLFGESRTWAGFISLAFRPQLTRNGNNRDGRVKDMTVAEVARNQMTDSHPSLCCLYIQYIVRVCCPRLVWLQKQHKIKMWNKKPQEAAMRFILRKFTAKLLASPVTRKCTIESSVVCQRWWLPILHNYLALMVIQWRTKITV